MISTPALHSLANLINWRQLPELAAWTIEEGIAIQQIPAPTFAEQRRAEYVRQRFIALGLEAVENDPIGNVWGVYRGVQSKLPGVLVSAHTDTIFSADTDLAIRRENDLIYGAGLGDNSLGVAGMLALIRALCDANIKPTRDLWFAATTREEGLGDLGGMKAVFSHLQPYINCVINLEGLALGHIYHAGIAVRRLHITATASGGHSWLHFGRPSAVHGIVQLGAKIAALKPALNPRTTFNIGMIDGGEAINAIATQASLWLDLRSEATANLEALEGRVRHEVRALEQEDLHFEVEVVGDRPAGSIPADHWLTKLAVEALAQINIQGTLEMGSTDGNVPLSQGCPAVTVGITRGGNAHRLDEYIEATPVSAGLRQIILLTLAAAQHQPS